jgi:hypothetical protein
MSSIPNIIAVVLNKQQQNTSDRGQKYIGEHSLDLNSDGKTCLKRPRSREARTIVIVTGWYIYMCVERSPWRAGVWRHAIAIIWRGQSSLNIWRFILVGSEIHDVDEVRKNQR